MSGWIIGAVVGIVIVLAAIEWFQYVFPEPTDAEKRVIRALKGMVRSKP